MNPERIKELVEEPFWTSDGITAKSVRKSIIKAIHEAKTEGMEEAAKICDATVKQAYDEGEGSTDIPAWISNCAKAIREVKDKL